MTTPCTACGDRTRHPAKWPGMLLCSRCDLAATAISRKRLDTAPVSMRRMIANLTPHETYDTKSFPAFISLATAEAKQYQHYGLSVSGSNVFGGFAANQRVRDGSHHQAVPRWMRRPNNR